MLLRGLAFSTFLLLVTSISGVATVHSDELIVHPSTFDVLKKDLTKKKMYFMAEAMLLSEKEGAKFWPLYKEFLEKRQKASEEALRLISFFTDDPRHFNDDKADQLIRKVFTTNRAIQSLEEEYYDRIAKVTSASTAARFLQAEYIINTLIDMQAISRIPIFPRIVDADKKADRDKK